MRIIKIKNVSGIELYINADAVSYFREDPMNSTRVQICLNNNDTHLVSYTLGDLTKLFAK